MSECRVSKHVPSFAKGLQILVVDNDRECLSIMATMLQLCSYKVTTTEQVSEAQSMIEEQETSFKLVMVCIDMPDSDPISFLKASVQRGIGVIMISSNRNGDLANKALEEGASLFLMKPVSMEVLKQLWQSACWKNTKLSEDNQNGNSGKEFQPIDLSLSEDNYVIREAMTNEEIGTRINMKRTRWQNCTTLSDYDDEFKSKSSEKQEGLQSKRSPSGIVIETSHRHKSKRKRSCAVWTPDLHHKFTEVINLLGDENAQPKTIQREMGASHLTRHQIASHLQYYKAEVKRTQENDTSLPFGAKSSIHATRSQFSQLERSESSMAYQLGREDLSFGPFSLTQPSANQGSSMDYHLMAFEKGKQPLEISPYSSSGVFQVNNFFLQNNHHQDTPPNIDSGFNFNHYTIQPSQEVAWTTDGPSPTLKTNILEYVDNNILRILDSDEEDDCEPHNSGCGPNIEDVNRYCEWLQKSI